MTTDWWVDWNLRQGWFWINWLQRVLPPDGQEREGEDDQAGYQTDFHSFWQGGIDQGFPFWTIFAGWKWICVFLGAEVCDDQAWGQFYWGGALKID